MKVLVTGMTGMLGTSLSRRFLEEGNEVYGLSRGKMSRDPFPKEHRFEADVTDQKEIQKMIQSIHPDVVIHAAAISDVDYCENSPEEAYQVNSEGTRVMAESAKACGATFCYISTDYVFDGENSVPYHEEDPCNPVNVYGRSKWHGEEHTRTTCKRYYIVRTSWLFGENQDSFVHHVLEWAKMKKSISLVSDKWSTPTYTPDLAESLHLLIEKNAPFGIYHVTNAGGCSWLEYGKAVLRYSGNSDITVLPMALESLPRTAKRPRQTVLSHEKFSRMTGENPRPWEEALREYVTTIKVHSPNP